MAGDWIKMRTSLLTHPKVVRMSSAFGADRIRTVGGIYAVWCLFDMHSEDGQLEGYTADALDGLVGLTGISAAMASVGWLEITEKGIKTPEFDTHNGQSAKRRATESERKRNDRKMSATDADKNGTDCGPEKRREENIENTDMSPAKLPTCPTGLVIQSYHDHLPTLPTVRLQSEARTKAVSTFWKWVMTSKRADGTPRAETAEQALQWIGEYFNRANDNDFLMGRNAQSGKHANWKADFDFLLTEKGKRHVIEKTGG